MAGSEEEGEEKEEGGGGYGAWDYGHAAGHGKWPSLPSAVPRGHLLCRPQRHRAAGSSLRGGITGRGGSSSTGM